MYNDLILAQTISTQDLHPNQGDPNHWWKLIHSLIYQIIFIKSENKTARKFNIRMSCPKLPHGPI